MKKVFDYNHKKDTEGVTLAMSLGFTEEATQEESNDLLNSIMDSAQDTFREAILEGRGVIHASVFIEKVEKDFHHHTHNVS